MKNYLLFDLDGTLTDPKNGITTCVQYALRSFGIEESDLDKLEPFIGPPLTDSFIQFYGMSGEDAALAVAKYRERFQDIGIFENEVYRGIPGMLKKLRTEGFHLAVASSKPTVYVKRILEHFHIAEYFEVVMGSELDGSRAKKAEVVEEALRQLFRKREASGKTEIDEEAFEQFKESVYMIGDTKFDVEGARACGVESVGVAYGYGGMEELMGAHADYIVRSVEELQSFLLRTVREQQLPPTTFGLMTELGVPVMVFMVMRTLVIFILGRLLFEELPLVPERVVDRFVYMENGGRQFTPNGSAIIDMLAFLCAGAVIWRRAKEEIERAWEATKLSHLRTESFDRYLLLIGATLGSMIGVHLLLTLTGIMTSSQHYNAFAQTNKQVTLFLGLLIYGIVSPVAEELLFRGILYNRLRRFAREYPAGCRQKGVNSPEFIFSKTLPAILISAALFGLYHMNIVQGIYAFVMGCLMAYGYEYFGSFLVPVMIHAGANLLARLVPIASLGYITKTDGSLGWIVCIVSLLVAGGCVCGLHRRKYLSTFL
ncbi:MAG: HAD hydrolase-like protein [Lachnospiraceae bacterium]|nr:HAD hydrolase-like protein [Lachnospiraceae bacterium]